MAVLNLIQYLAFLIILLPSSVLIVNIDLIETVLEGESISRGEFQIAIVILTFLFTTLAFVMSKR